MVPPKKEYDLSNEIQRFGCHAEKKIEIIKKLRETIKNDNPDIIIIMDTPMCVFSVPALEGLNIPYIVSERSNPNTNAIKKTTKIFSHLLMKRCNGYVFQTNGAKEYFSKSIQKKSIVIANPIEVSKLPKIYNGRRAKKIVAVGRLIEAKNYPLLINAFDDFYSKHSEYVLEIYGDGKERTNIEKLIQTKKSHSNIMMMGVHDDVLEKIKNASIFILSSDLEGMPNALIESMAMGIPSISTDCPSGGPKDLIINKKDGILIPTNDKTALVSAMNEIVDDLELQNLLSVNSVKIRERLNIERIALQWKEYINYIVDRYGNRRD